MHECFASSEIERLTDESYSIKVASSIEKERKKDLKLKFAWSLMPQELRPSNKRKTGSTHKPNIKPKKLKTTEEIETTLKILEEKETRQPTLEETDKPKVEGSDSEVEQEEDEKMDLEDDLDYGNNYFDNGEDYNEESGDEGPVY